MTAALWEIDALIEATGGRPYGSPPTAVTGLSIDTRTLQPGDAFFAIKGDRFDGHNYLAAAMAAGASVMVVAEQKLPALGRVQAPMIVVDDVLQALERLAAASRARSKAQIVAVTGSVGKTTTKEALRHALSASGAVHASAASFNNHWGVPLSLARMPAETRFAVFEIGMNHPGEIRPLVKLVRPHVAIITLIAAAHIGHFRDLDEIAEAKAEIFEGLTEGGTAVLNADDPQFDHLVALARQAGTERIKTFGERGDADFRLLEFSGSGDGAHLLASIDGDDVDLPLASAGRHLAQNVLAVLGAAKLVGADVAASAEALSSWRAGKGRGERHALTMPDGGGFVLFDESYNANPASMRAAIEVLKSVRPGAGGRRLAVLGDMLEMGEQAPAFHAALAEPLQQAGIDRVFLSGEAMKVLDEALDGKLACEWHEDAQELGASLMAHIGAGDAIMVKASNGLGFSKIVDRLIAKYAPRTPEPAVPASVPAGEG